MKHLRIFNESVDFKSLIDIALDVCKNYPQDWGDCYKINSTAAYWLNKKLGEWRMRIYQVRAELDSEIFDDDVTGYTDEPYHVIVVDGYSKRGIDDSDNFYPGSDSVWYDFSNVFIGDRECEILGIIYESELGGEVCDDLVKLLDSKL